MVAVVAKIAANRPLLNGQLGSLLKSRLPTCHTDRHLSAIGLPASPWTHQYKPIDSGMLIGCSEADWTPVGYTSAIYPEANRSYMPCVP